MRCHCGRYGLWVVFKKSLLWDRLVKSYWVWGGSRQHSSTRDQLTSSNRVEREIYLGKFLYLMGRLELGIDCALMPCNDFDGTLEREKSALLIDYIAVQLSLLKLHFVMCSCLSVLSGISRWGLYMSYRFLFRKTLVIIDLIFHSTEGCTLVGETFFWSSTVVGIFMRRDCSMGMCRGHIQNISRDYARRLYQSAPKAHIRYGIISRSTRVYNKGSHWWRLHSYYICVWSRHSYNHAEVLGAGSETVDLNSYM